MKKNFFDLTVCALLFALSFPAGAQEPKKVPRIGMLFAATPSANSERIEAFRQGLRERGYVEGKDILIEQRFSQSSIPTQNGFDTLFAFDIVRKMTLILTVNGPESIWLLADRRLSYNGHIPPKDDARKLMFLHTTDGVAILGYAGLGATALGREPADWMSAVLRGRDLSLERSLEVLAEAMKKQFPEHLLRIRGNNSPTHCVIVPSFVANQARVYAIELIFAADRKTYAFRYARHIKPQPASTIPPRLAVGARGGLYLKQNKEWTRGLFRLVKAYDRGQVPPHSVADYLAKLNDRVHLADKTVGPRCIVAWRNRDGVHKGGGAHQFYTHTTRDADSSSLPTIANGGDVHALIDLIKPHMSKVFEGNQETQDKLNAELSRLPDKPDEKLR